MSENFNLFEDLLVKYSPREIANLLYVSNGTVVRWIDKKSVPELYRFDIMKLLDIDIDYSKFNFKDKDQFFTPELTAIECYNTVLLEIGKYENSINEYIFIEPSAGNGSFYKILPGNRKIGLDIEPNYDGIIKHDFLKWKPTNINKKYITIGNPPFGLRGHMALKFINHASTFSDYVCFILPQLFESDGKGVPRKRVEGMNLLYSKKLDSDFISPDGKTIKIKCIFQIWSKNHKNDKYELINKRNNNIRVYSLSDGGTPSSTRNKKLLDKCDIYIPSTCYGEDNMRYYDSFEELPNRKGYGIIFNDNKENQIQRFKNIDWKNVAFLSTNSAYNLRTTQIIQQFE